MATVAPELESQSRGDRESQFTEQKPRSAMGTSAGVGKWEL